MATKDQDETRSERLMRRLAEELIEMPEVERLGGEDAEAALAFGMKIFSSAKHEAGRRRMERAKQKAAAPAAAQRREPAVSAEEARAYLRAAAQRPEWTLAARELNEISDSDILQLYQQIRQLESDQGD